MPNQEVECPVPGCGYNDNMREYNAALARLLHLKTTRSNASSDAHRDMDGFDVDEELARLRRAVKEVEANPENLKVLYFIVEAFSNIDEQLQRLGPLPHAWVGSARTWVGTEKRLRPPPGEGVEDMGCKADVEP